MHCESPHHRVLHVLTDLCRTAYRSGVTLATSSLARPIYLSGPDAHIISGLSVVFRTGAAHSMQRGAVIQEVAALHIVMGNPYPTSRGVSMSTQIAALRRLLYGWESTETETGAWFKKAAEVSLEVPKNETLKHIKKIGCCSSRD